VILYSSTLGVIRVVAGRVRGAAKAVERGKIGAAYNALSEKAIKRSVEARSAEALRKSEARRAKPTWHSVDAEARRAEGRGPKGRGEILGVVNLLGKGSEPGRGAREKSAPRAMPWRRTP